MSECDREASIMGRPWPYRGCLAIKTNLCVCVCVCVRVYVCMCILFSNAVAHDEFSKLNLQYPDFHRISLVDASSFN